MQCTRCGNALPGDVRFCQACGQPVTTNLPGAATEININNDMQDAEAAMEAASQDAAGYTGFVFQEFKPVPGVAPQAGVPVAPGAPLPSTPWPGMPGTPLPGAQEPGMYAPYVPSAPGYPAYAMPATPPQPRRRGTSVGCIVSYVLLAILLVFGALGFALFEIGSHLAPNTSAQKTAAMQLYQQVISTQPGFTDSLTNASASLWTSYQKSTYGCAIQSDGLHAHMDETDHFSSCIARITSQLSDFAFQVQMKILSGDNGGLIFRYAGEGSGFYFFEMSESGAYRVYVGKGSSPTPTFLAGGTTQEVNPPPGQTNTLTVIAKGQQFDFYVNGQFIVQVQDATYQRGYLGVTANDLNNPTEVLYTNAKIWDLNS